MFERISLFMSWASRTWEREEGQTVSEYALVVAFVAILLAAVLVTLAGGIGDFINQVTTALQALPGFSKP
jgi:Flp pilus assembly pilin Flp